MKPRYRIIWITPDCKPYTHGNLQGKTIRLEELSFGIQNRVFYL
jgi:hypothetical protein